MTTATSKEQTKETAFKIAEYLGINPEIINTQKASVYIVYPHNGNTFELRISDHCANPSREEAKKVMSDYVSVECGNNWATAKRIIDQKVLGKVMHIEKDAIVTHPFYGEGIVISHDLAKDKLDVIFNGEEKSLCATAVINKGWVNI